MKDFKYIWLLLLLILNSFGACSDDDPLMPDLILIRLFLKRMNH